MFVLKKRYQTAQHHCTRVFLVLLETNIKILRLNRTVVQDDFFKSDSNQDLATSVKVKFKDDFISGTYLKTGINLLWMDKRVIWIMIYSQFHIYVVEAHLLV